MAPPPVLITIPADEESSSITADSSCLKYPSPNCANISFMPIPALFSIRSSVSAKLIFNSCASHLPTEDLPVPIKPVRMMFFISRIQVKVKVKAEVEEKIAPTTFFLNLNLTLTLFFKTSSNSPNTLYSFSLSHQENHRQTFLKRHWQSQGQPQTRRSQRQQAQRIYLTFPHLPEKIPWYLYPLTLMAYKASVSVSSQPLTGLVRRYSYLLQCLRHYLSSYKTSVPPASFLASCPLPLVPFYRRFHHAPLSQTYRPLQIPYPPQLP